jgi:hypothetical protein
MGAGVIPFCARDGQVLFLFHKTFSGRRAGHLVDFGGGGEPGESHRQTAIREFIEETETMYLFANPRAARITRERVRAQTPILEALFDRTLRNHPDWWCQRAKRSNGKPRDWKTFFIEFEYRDVTDMNLAWKLDGGTRFRKRRELVWLPAGRLSDIFEHSPDSLWKRVRQLVNATATIRAITAAMSGQQTTRQAGRTA